MKNSRIGIDRYRKSVRSRTVAAALLVAALAATLVVGAAAATKKASHVNRAHRERTTAHLMKRDLGGTLPFKPPPGGTLPFTG